MGEEEEEWGGSVGRMSEDMGLEGGLYTQGNVANISLEGQGLSNRISEKGRCESDPMVDKKKRRVAALQHPSSRRQAMCPFRFFSEYAELHHAPSPKRNRLQSTYAHLSEKIIHPPSFVPCPSSPFLCRSPVISVARGGILPPHGLSELRTTCTCPMAPDVLNAYYPFKDPSLPILQRLARELFHPPPQIRPRYRR